MAVKMIFIGGTGRCGTSILKEALALHPQAASLPFEYRFIIGPDGILDFYAHSRACWTPSICDKRLKRLSRFLRRLAYEPMPHRLAGNLIKWVDPQRRWFSPRQHHGWDLSQWLPNYERHIEKLLSNLVDFSFQGYWPASDSYQVRPELWHCYKDCWELARILGGFIESVIGDLLKETGKQFFVEDNTWNVFLARELVDLLPHARIVHIFRDPRDVVASFTRQDWGPHNPADAARWYADMMDHWLAVRRELAAHCYREVSLERLVDRPAEVLHELCAFAEVAYDPAMLEIDLSHAHTGRWQRDFSAEEQQAVCSIVGKWLEVLGYA